MKMESINILIKLGKLEKAPYNCDCGTQMVRESTGMGSWISYCPKCDKEFLPNGKHWLGFVNKNGG